MSDGGLTKWVEEERKRRWDSALKKYRKDPTEPFQGDAAAEAIEEALDLINYHEQLWLENRIELWKFRSIKLHLTAMVGDLRRLLREEKQYGIQPELSLEPRKPAMRVSADSCARCGHTREEHPLEPRDGRPACSFVAWDLGSVELA